ncbi:transcriptional regulatory protein ZraR [bacterium BMS3Abin05]|nr:transcriptional regulatory protein ZraR [bacterium BMS3Abin05]GBE27222.1 transcriptional regulatory protein ZraR [bacterium BMS3Bbin03]HDZ13198.1 sigma-54-dependent Fis family transcriptional regulator [Bacteroidota bacterium]
MGKASILVVEDNEDLCTAVAYNLKKKDYDAETAFSGETALDKARRSIFDLVLLDINLPGIDGITVLKRLKAHDPDLLVIMITAYGDLSHAISAMQGGAYDYLTKPFELEELRLKVEKALETQRLRREVNQLRRRELEDPIQGIYGRSPKIQAVKDLITLVAHTPRTPVLIQGQSGTGKELVANALHYASARKDKPLVKINCSAIPDNLIESELFGHEKGAFTDAKILKKGLFEMANGGTLFLDEISSLKLSLQPKLLRVLETHTLRRVGGTVDISVNLRIVAATNLNLENRVKEGEFREDLFYRLKVMVIDVPPLREREEDILPLAKLFLDQNNREFNKHIEGISPEAEQLLLHYPWPGNVRELKNVLERAAILCQRNWLEPEFLPHELQIKSESARVEAESEFSAHLSLSEMEMRHILRVLKENKNNKSKTARVLGISRSTLREKLRIYGLAGDSDADEED